MESRYAISPERSAKVYARSAPRYKWMHGFQTLFDDRWQRRQVVARIPPSSNVLDIGTGTALAAVMAAEKAAKVTGIDRSGEMLRVGAKEVKKSGRTNIELIAADAAWLPIGDNTFDAVIGAYSLGGMRDPFKALQEAIRVAKDGAKIVFAEMVCPPASMPIRRFIHRHFVEPIIKLRWEFRDIDPIALFEKAWVDIDIKNTQYTAHRLFGSTMIVEGTVVKDRIAKLMKRSQLDGRVDLAHFRQAWQDIICARDLLNNFGNKARYGFSTPYQFRASILEFLDNAGNSLSAARAACSEEPVIRVIAKTEVIVRDMKAQAEKKHNDLPKRLWHG